MTHGSDRPPTTGGARRRWTKSCVSLSGNSLSLASSSTLGATSDDLATHTHTHGTYSWLTGFYNTHTHRHSTHLRHTHTHAHTNMYTNTHTHTHKDKHTHTNTYKRTLAHAHAEACTAPPTGAFSNRCNCSTPVALPNKKSSGGRSEEHTSELQSR